MRTLDSVDRVGGLIRRAAHQAAESPAESPVKFPAEPSAAPVVECRAGVGITSR